MLATYSPHVEFMFLFVNSKTENSHTYRKGSIGTRGLC